MKHTKLYIMIISALFLMTGCLNPGSEEAQNHIAYKSDITAVQEAVNSFQKETHVLPIKNSTEKTPIYKKYPIDFGKLDHNYMASPPANAYEEGGIFQYVLVHAETKPTVRVIDLTLTNTVDEIQRKIDDFRYNHHFSPLKSIVMDGIYKINFKEIGYDKPPYVISPFSGKELGFVMDKDSKVYINYLPDIYGAVKKSGKTIPVGKDLRPLLVDNSFFVPVDSLPYTIKNGEVTFLIK
jgi:predicted  nucleic acid-binding Zn-ribbon protein